MKQQYLIMANSMHVENSNQLEIWFGWGKKPRRYGLDGQPSTIQNEAMQQKSPQIEALKNQFLLTGSDSHTCHKK